MMRKGARRGNPYLHVGTAGPAGTAEADTAQALIDLACRLGAAVERQTNGDWD